MLLVGRLPPAFLISQKSKIFDSFPVCGTRQLLRPAKRACILPTAAHTALALDSATGGGQARGPGGSLGAVQNRRKGFGRQKFVKKFDFSESFPLQVGKLVLR